MGNSDGQEEVARTTNTNKYVEVPDDDERDSDSWRFNIAQH
jgi:hypothetical protein